MHKYLKLSLLFGLGLAGGIFARKVYVNRKAKKVEEKTAEADADRTDEEKEATKAINEGLGLPQEGVDSYKGQLEKVLSKMEALGESKSDVERLRSQMSTLPLKDKSCAFDLIAYKYKIQEASEKNGGLDKIPQEEEKVLAHLHIMLKRKHSEETMKRISKELDI